jgi:RecB family exonuclease
LAPVHVAPYREIAARVAARLLDGRGNDPLAPWNEEVLVPSRGMAEAIAAEVLRSLSNDREPRGVAGLQIRFLEDLARTIVNRAGQWPRVASEAERRLAMRMAVRAIDHPIMEGRGIAAMMERSYRDVRDSGLRVTQIQTRAAIARAFHEYERLIASANAIDPADLLSLAERSIGDVRPQIIAGFYDMTGAQLAFVRALLPHVTAVFVPTEMPFAKPFLDAMGSYTTSTFPSSAQDVLECDDEIREVCAHIASLIAEGETSIGITARSLDPYDVALINRLVPTTNAGETPLAAHRIGRGAITLLRLRDRGFPRGDVLELMRDGLQPKTHIDVDRADYETRKYRIAGGTHKELAPLRGRSEAIDAYITLIAELEALPLDFAQLSSLFQLETDLDLLAAEKLDNLAVVFARLHSNDASSFIDAIEHESLPCPPPSALRAPIWLGDVMRLRGRSFQHLFVLRMQDDIFPQRRTEDPLLPDIDRRKFGVREIGDGRAEEELLLQLLRDSASHIHFSYAISDGFGKVLRPSRFVRRLSGAAAAPGRRIARTPNATVHSGGRGRPPLHRPLQLIAKSGTRSLFDGYLPALTPTLRALSPTQLEDFGECPQKFLLKHLLGVEDVEHPERELQINHRDKGSIDHRILENFYRSMSAEEFARAAASLPNLPDETIERLECIIDEQFDQHERIVPPFNRTVRAIERRATKRILREFVANDIAELAANELTPRHFEYRFGAKHRVAADHPDPFIVDARGMQVRVEGTIDRIDVGASRLRIVDYKSGKALRHKDLPEKIDRGVRLQLALYAMAAAEFFAVDATNVSGTIKPLVITDKAKFAFDLHEKRAALIETLEIFLSAIAHGVFPAFPMDDDFNSCKYCPVNHSCRTRHDQEERYAIQQQRDPRTLLGGGGA